MSIVYSGDSGADVITGGGENETIDGAAGADTLTGGAGTDTLDVSTNFNVTETGSAIRRLVWLLTLVQRL